MPARFCAKDIPFRFFAKLPFFQRYQDKLIFGCARRHFQSTMAPPDFIEARVSRSGRMAYSLLSTTEARPLVTASVRAYLYRHAPPPSYPQSCPLPPILYCQRHAHSGFPLCSRRVPRDCRSILRGHTTDPAAAYPKQWNERNELDLFHLVGLVSCMGISQIPRFQYQLAKVQSCHFRLRVRSFTHCSFNSLN